MLEPFNILGCRGLVNLLTADGRGKWRDEGRVARPVGSGEGEGEVGRTERGVGSSETSGERGDLLRSGERPPHFLLSTRFSPLPTHPRHFPLVSPLAPQLAPAVQSCASAACADASLA